MAMRSVITYVYIRGKWYAFPDVNSAREGATRYGGNIKSLRMSKPVGVVVDNTTLFNKMYWPNAIADAEGVTGDALINPPVNPIYSSQPVIETPVVETVVQQSSAPASSPASPRSGGGGGGDPGKKKVFDFREYVEGNRDLARAFQQYKKNQDPGKIDSWEKHGKVGGAFKKGPTTGQDMSGIGDPKRNPNLATGYGGQELNIEQWGNIHWNKHGKKENRDIKAWKKVKGNDPRYEGNWEDFLV